MHSASFVIFLIFFGAAVFATVALYTRQTMILAYMFLGFVAGPYGLELLNSNDLVLGLSDIGIMFLLFLLGLNLQFESMMRILNKAVVVTFGSSIIVAVLSMLTCRYFDYGWTESVLMGVSMLFSSTIICLKLLPTTALHHQRLGNIVIGILLLQDILAIVMLTMLDLLSARQSESTVFMLLKILMALPLLVVLSYVVQRFIMYHLLRRFNRFKEYIFLLAVAWCLGLAELASWLGVSAEIGAFIAGVAMASSPIAQFISESLKPLRDFFLIIFFFSVGAGFNPALVPEVWPVVVALAAISLIIKPVAYRGFLSLFQEKRSVCWEIGLRVGQASEFSLLLGKLALDSHVIDHKAFVVIQAAAIVTFVVSSYIVVLRLPNPIALTDRLRMD